MTIDTAAFMKARGRVLVATAAMTSFGMALTRVVKDNDTVFKITAHDAIPEATLAPVIKEKPYWQRNYSKKRKDRY